MHELTDLMYKRLNKEHTREEVDFLVVEYLQEAANKMAYSFPKDGTHEGRYKWAANRLGLSR